MAQDIVSDALNQIMNARRTQKTEVRIRRYSKVLVGILEIMKSENKIDYRIEDGALIVEIIKLNECRAVKPRYYAKKGEIDKYLRRFLPSRNFGTLIISTNQGLLSHKDVIDKNIGGSIIAYFY